MSDRPPRWQTFLAAGKLGWQLGSPEAAYAVEDPGGSYVVLPFAHRAETTEEAELAEHAAARLTRQLRGWETIRGELTNPEVRRGPRLSRIRGQGPC